MRWHLHARCAAPHKLVNIYRQIQKTVRLHSPSWLLYVVAPSIYYLQAQENHLIKPLYINTLRHIYSLSSPNFLTLSNKTLPSYLPKARSTMASLSSAPRTIHSSEKLPFPRSLPTINKLPFMLSNPSHSQTLKLQTITPKSPSFSLPRSSFTCKIHADPSDSARPSNHFLKFSH